MISSNFSGYIYNSFFCGINISEGSDIKKYIFFLIVCLLLNLSLMAQEKDEDYLRWVKEYERTKARVRTWDTIQAAGGGMLILGTALYILDKEEVEKYGPYGLITTEEKHKTHHAIMGLAGAGIGLIGFILAEPARGDLRALEIEGEKKG